MSATADPSLDATPPARPRWDRRDLLALLILTLTCLALRLPALDRIGLNPDESQYESTAAYLVATGGSAFELPYGPSATYELYRIVALVFGPYSMFEMRVLVILICLATAFLLYALVRRETDPWSGLVAGLILVHYVVAFEGHTANREWFAGFFLVLGVYLYSICGRARSGRRLWLLLASGAAYGCALWFKQQVAPIFFVVPLVLVWDSCLDGRLLRAWRDLAAYVAGFGVAVLFQLALLAAHGTLPAYLKSFAIRWTEYAGARAGFLPAGDGLARFYLDRFFWMLPGRAILLVAFLLAAFSLAGVAWRLARNCEPGPPLTTRSPVLLFALYLGSALVAIRAGHRFFEHYYLFLVPPVAALFGLALHSFRRADCRRGRGFVIGTVLLGLLALLRFWPIQRLSLSQVELAWPESATLIPYHVLALALLAFWILRPRNRMRTALAATLVLECVLLVAQAHLAELPRSLLLQQDPFSDLVREIESRAGPRDRLFVWGWCPEIYSVTRMEPASDQTICGYLVSDYRTVAEPRIDRRLEATLMRDLEQRTPRFIVDATSRSYTMATPHEPWAYELERYPDFAFVEFLETNYRPVGSFNGCELYVLDEAGEGEPISPPNRPGP